LLERVVAGRRTRGSCAQGAATRGSSVRRHPQAPGPGAAPALNGKRPRTRCGSAADAWGRCSDLAEDAVQVCTTDGTLGLRHPRALVVHVDLATRLALLLALHAVELAAPGFRHDGLLAH